MSAFQVLDCFRPGRFLLSFFSNSASTAAHRGQQEVWESRQIGGDYHRLDCQFLELPGDTVVYASYLKTVEEWRGPENNILAMITIIIAIIIFVF